VSRTPSALFRQAAYAPETSEVPVLLITVEHNDIIDTPIRISTDNGFENEIDGQRVLGTLCVDDFFVYCPVSITLPDDTDDTISSATIEVDNVDRSIMAAIRTITSPPTVTIKIVLASTPNTIEASFDNFKLSSVDADAMTISGKLSLGNFLGEPYPGGSMLPSNFPGLF
jgi:hypothetical protein